MNVYRHSYLAVPLFLAFFGVVFVVFGTRRLLKASKGKGVVDSIVWGSVGVFLGVGFLYGAYWLFGPAVAT